MSEQGERREGSDRRRGGAIGAVAAIVAGAALVAGAASISPPGAVVSALVTALVWYPIVTRKPRIKRRDLIGSALGAALLLWGAVVLLPRVAAFLFRPVVELDSEGKPAVQKQELPANPDQEFLWYETMAGAGLLAAGGFCLVGYGVRTFTRRRGRRRHSSGKRPALGADGLPVADREPTPVTPVAAMPAVGAGSAAVSSSSSERGGSSGSGGGSRRRRSRERDD